LRELEDFGLSLFCVDYPVLILEGAVDDLIEEGNQVLEKRRVNLPVTLREFTVERFDQRHDIALREDFVSWVVKFAFLLLLLLLLGSTLLLAGFWMTFLMQFVHWDVVRIF